jgi:lipoprotein-anchoring transpeptidase ErfK/SrfK
MARTRYRLIAVAAVALAAASLVRVVGGSEASTGERTALPVATVVPVDPPMIAFADAQGETVPSDRPLQVSVTNGTLTGVTVEDGAGLSLPGDVAPDGLAWTSSEPPVPQTAYTVRVSALGADQGPFDQTLTVTSSAPSAVLRATLSPNDGEVVGVGMPAVVTFSRPVAEADRRAVEERLTVSAVPATEGAWRWISPARVHWRPSVYWQPGTEVGLHSDLRGLRAGEAWGADDERTIRFRIGETHVSTVDVNTHQMTVTENGQVLRVMPVSTGQKRYPTHNGVHLALEKSRTVTMDSSTIGIPRNGPGGYYRKVAWATRLSYSGTFIHAAPWSVGSQGQRNVSHGCINASTADAQWFFNFTRRGDVVDVVNSPAKPKLYDPGMSDWNIPWERWKVGSTG